VKANERVELADLTEAFSVLGVMGPNSRRLLQSLTDADLSNKAFPFATAQTIAIGRATVRAVRLTYVGELGWELHVPVGQSALLYDTLMQEGAGLEIINAGHYAINSLRLEKGYRAWGADISPDDTALEAGLGFAVAWDKAGFIGKEALLEQKQKGLGRMLVTFVLRDPEPVLWGSEPIYRDGAVVGYTTSGAYGHTLGGAVGMGYVKHSAGVTPNFIRSGHYEINVSGRCIPANAHLRSPYDADRVKILAEACS
jgi:4-methylaminobutanoate oxidase (formaldehyde-forming)